MTGNFRPGTNKDDWGGFNETFFLFIYIMNDSPASKPLEESEDNTFSELNSLTRLLHDLDDRGLVLSLSAFAEDSLGTLLTTFMLPSDASKKLLEGFNAPLGTFSARTMAAYSLGLINRSQFDDLERLRKIRNEFAHTWETIETTKQNISSLIGQMSFSRIDDHFPETPNEKLRSSIICLLIELSSMVNQLSKQGPKITMLGRHLMTGFSGSFKDQLQSARNLLKEILQNLKTSDSVSRKFYMEQLRRFSDRMNVLGLPHKSSLKSEEYLSFIEEVRVVLNQHGIVNELSICELHLKIKVLNEKIAYLNDEIKQQN